MSSPVVATCNTSISAPAVAPATAITFEGLDHWLNNFQKYKTILLGMVSASANGKFKNELTTTEQWFKVLSGPERTALMYTLLQHSTQEQMHFFSAVLQQMNPEDGHSSEPKSTKTGVRSPSLDNPLHDSPGTPAPNFASKPQDSAVHGQLLDLSKPTNMVNTSTVPMFQKLDSGKFGSKESLAAIKASTLNLFATSGLSSDAQLLAVRLVMSGILHPAYISSTVPNQGQATSSTPIRKGRRPSHKDSRSPSSSKYPNSVLRSGARSGVPKSSGLKNNSKTSGLAISSLDSPPNESPKLEDLDPELLNDISAWLRRLRLHKYNSCFDGVVWQEMVTMDDAALEKKGVAALGARRRLLRTFDCVRRKMGTELNTNSAAPPTSAVPSSAASSSTSDPVQSGLNVPQSAAPRLPADSSVFVPTGKVPQSAASASQPVVTSVV